MPTMPSFNKDVSVEITLQHSSSIAADEESTIDQRNLEQLHGENDYDSVAPSSSSPSSCLKKKHVAAALALITVTAVAVGVGMGSSNSSKNKATSATAAMSEFEMYGASSSSSKSGKSHKSSLYSRSGDDPNDEETKSPTQ